MRKDRPARVFAHFRYAGQVIDVVVLVALGVTPDGLREVLGISVELSEAEVHWRQFLTRLKDRGGCGVHLFVSDSYAGLKATRAAVYPAEHVALSKPNDIAQLRPIFFRSTMSLH